MSQKIIRVVIRQPLHNLVKEWSEALGIDDVGEVVNFLLLDLKRAGYQPTNTKSEILSPQHQTNNEASEISDLAGLF